MDKELQSIDEFDVYNVETNNIQKGYSTDSNDNINIRGINDVLPERLDGGSFALKPVDDSSILEAVGVKGFAKGFGSGMAQFGGQLYFGGKAVGTGLLGATAETGLKLGSTITGSKLLDNLGVDRQQFDEFTKEASSIIDEKTKDIQHNYFIQNEQFKNRIAEEFNLKGTTSENIGAGFGSVFTAIGTNFLFGAPAVLASFGLSQGSETFMKAREKGMTNLESLLYGTATGTGEAVLEEVGLQLFAGGIAKRGIVNFVKGTLGEGIEEAQQTFSSETIEKLAGIDDKTWGEIFKDSAISLWYTVIGAGIMGGVSKVAMGKGRNAFAKKLMETAGLSEEEAYKVADKVEEHSREHFEEDSNAVMNSQLDLDKFKDRDYENVIGRTKQIIAGKRQVEEANHQAIVDIIDNSNLKQEEKDRTVAMMEASFMANEELYGKSVADQINEFKNMKIRSESEAVSEPMDRLAFEDNDNTYVNEAGELVDKTTGQVLFQSAYAGSRVDYDRPSLEAIGSGEGNQAHGYGLYYALDKDVAESYRETFTNENKQIPYTVLGDKTLVEYIKENGKQKAKEVIQNKINESEMKIKAYEDIGDNFTAQIWQGHRDELQTLLKATDTEGKGQVHEVDIPENFVLLDEQKKITKQYAKVKKGIIEAMKEAGLEHFTSVSSLSNFTGKEMYEKISHTLGSDKQASELLEKHGIKGITYFGSQDGRCFVIFNPDDVQVVNKFYQKEQEQQDIRGYVDVANKLVNVLQTGNKDTVVHELNHLFSIYRIDLAIQNNNLESLNPLFKYFGLDATVENAMKLRNEEYYQEELAQMSINYVAQHEAPSIGLRKYFQDFKQWAQSVWENLVNKGLVKEEELSPDVVEFFDSLYSTKEIDIESVAKAREQVRQLVKDIKAGKAVNIENVNLDEVYRLLDAKNRRIPRAPKNLRQALVSAGGISNTLAENLDLKELMGEQDKKYSRLFTDNGKIKNENQLVEFLKSEGFMAQAEAETDTEVGSEFDRAKDLLENAQNVYSENDMEALAVRENTLQAVEEANQLLDALGVDAEEVMQHIQELKKSDITAVSKSEVKQLDNKIKELEKEYKKLNKEVIKSTKENMQEMRDKVVDFIRAQKIDGEDKAKLITKVKQANTEYMLDKTLNEIAEKSKEYYEKEQKTILANAIEKELKKTKAKDVKNQKYLYEDNKLFNNLRNYSKMTQAEAEIELSKFMGKEDLTYDEQLEKLYLSYKANGKDDTSVDLMNELLDTIRYTKLQSKQAKDEKEFLDYLDRKENKDEMIRGVRTRKVTSGFEKGVARFVNGLNSMLRFVAGKDIAEKYNFENLETQKNIKTFNFYEAQAKESMDIFGFKKMGDLLNKIQEMRKQVATLSYYDEKLGQGKYDLTKMDIIDLYNDYKNADTKRAMDNIYGEAQITELIDMLTDEEKEFGDSLQKYINERYQDTNKVFVKAYQTDLPQVENYWPRTSERTTNETDAFDTFKKPSETPSQLKERKKGNVIVKPMDAYSKFQNHIESSFYLTEMALPYKELSETINSMRVKNEITNKFDEKVYKDLKELVDNLSYSEYFAYRKKDLQSGMYDKILNNWVSAKIGGLAPTVFVKQLLSATNYATEMGYKNWAKGFVEGLANPKQTIKFMEQYAGDYLKQRYKTGYNDAMSRVKEDAGNTPKVIPANIKSGLMDAITWMTRTGDISAIIYGGYPRLKQLINSGMSEEEAVKTWITETERAQQSRTMANQSRFQHNRTYRLISNFKNTPIQYMRKINDTIVGYMNGDIDKATATRTLFNYAVVQPVLLGLVTAMMYNITAPDDKDKSYLDETIKALIMQFFNPVGGVSDVAGAFVDSMQGNKVYDMQTPAFGEMVQAVKKLQKKNKDAFDYIEIMLPFIEATTGAPISRTEKQIKALAK